MNGRASRLALATFIGAMWCALAQTPGPFTASGNMTTPRQFHTATLLTNGKVLVTGGINLTHMTVPLASAELYDPSTGTFTATGNMTTPRSDHAAILLPDGKVLLTGGIQTILGLELSSAELYDPATGTFTDTGNMTTARRGHIATLLNNGKVLITGVNAELYDPSTGTFTLTGNPIVPGVETATLLPNGKVLITRSGQSFSHDNAELYDPDTGSFTLTGDLITMGGLPAATLLTNGKVLIAGGGIGTGDFDGGTTDADVYDPATGAFSATGQMTVGIGFFHAAALLPEGKVLIAGESGAATGTAELYDPVAGTFSAPFNSQSEEGHRATLLPDGTVLLSGGWYLCATAPIGFAPPGCGGTLAIGQIYHPGVLVPAPQLFSLSGDPGGQGAIWHSQTGQIASSQNPAVAGEILSMYTTSLVENGSIPPQVAVGGRLAEILFFGDAPGYPGYNQVNFRMPAGVSPGSAVPMRLTYLSRSSNPVTIGAQ
jgi:hypothetical protein